MTWCRSGRAYTSNDEERLYENRVLLASDEKEV